MITEEEIIEEINSLRSFGTTKIEIVEEYHKDNMLSAHLFYTYDVWLNIKLKEFKTNKIKEILK